MNMANSIGPRGPKPTRAKITLSFTATSLLKRMTSVYSKTHGFTRVDVAEMAIKDFAERNNFNLMPNQPTDFEESEFT